MLGSGRVDCWNHQWWRKGTRQKNPQVSIVQTANSSQEDLLQPPDDCVCVCVFCNPPPCFKDKKFRGGLAEKNKHVLTHYFFKNSAIHSICQESWPLNRSLKKWRVSCPSATHCFMLADVFQPTTPKKNTPGFLHERDQNLLKPAEVARRASVVALRCGTCFLGSGRSDRIPMVASGCNPGNSPAPFSIDGFLRTNSWI